METITVELKPEVTKRCIEDDICGVWYDVTQDEVEAVDCGTVWIPGDLPCYEIGGLSYPQSLFNKVNDD